LLCGEKRKRKCNRSKLSKASLASSDNIREERKERKKKKKKFFFYIVAHRIIIVKKKADNVYLFS
jgi:hypothetical protein